MLELLIPLVVLYLASVALLVSRIRPPTPEATLAPRSTEVALLRDQSLRLRVEGTARAALRTTKFVVDAPPEPRVIAFID